MARCLWPADNQTDGVLLVLNSFHRSLLILVLSLLQVFRTDECVCVYTLHGHADSISCLSVDKVRC